MKAYRCGERGECIEEEILKNAKIGDFIYGGSRGIRTPDFLRVKETL